MNVLQKFYDLKLEKKYRAHIRIKNMAQRNLPGEEVELQFCLNFV